MRTRNIKTLGWVRCFAIENLRYYQNCRVRQHLTFIEPGNLYRTLDQNSRNAPKTRLKNLTLLSIFQTKTRIQNEAERIVRSDLQDLAENVDSVPLEISNACNTNLSLSGMNPQSIDSPRSTVFGTACTRF